MAGLPCVVRVGGKSLTMEGVSDTTDALGDLLRAGLALGTGAARAEFSFDGEPNEWRWLIEIPLTLRILGFASIFDRKPPESGVVLLEAECNPDDFARAALVVGQSVLSRYGVEGYSKQWGWHPFPLRALRALEAALAT